MATDAPSESPRNWRRFFRFRLRTLFLFMTAVAVTLGFALPIHRQKQLIADLRARGAVISYDYEYGPWDTESTIPPKKLSDAIPPGPVWLRELIGIEAFANVVAVELKEPCSDEDLPRLAEFPRLRRLKLNGRSFTPEAMSALRELKRLEALECQKTRLRDEAFSLIAELPSLREIRFPFHNGCKLSAQITRSPQKNSVWLSASTEDNVGECGYGRDVAYFIDVNKNFDRLATVSHAMNRLSECFLIHELRLERRYLSERHDVWLKSYIRNQMFGDRFHQGDTWFNVDEIKAMKSLSELSVLFIEGWPLHPRDVMLLAKLRNLREVRITLPPLDDFEKKLVINALEPLQQKVSVKIEYSQQTVRQSE